MSRVPRKDNVTEADLLREQERARRTIDDYEVRQQILTVLRAGGSITDAARFAGIGPNTLRTWYARGVTPVDGRKPPRKYRLFAQEIDKARATSKIQALGTIAAAMRSTHKRVLKLVDTDSSGRNITRSQIVEEMTPHAVTAAAWFLANRFPKEFGTARVQHMGAGGGPVEVRVDDAVGSARERVGMLLGAMAAHAMQINGGAFPALESAGVLPTSAQLAAGMRGA